MIEPSNQNLEFISGMAYKFLSRNDMSRDECDEKFDQLIMMGK